jgi:hypothetical protein
VDEISLTVEPWILPIHKALTEFVNEMQEQAIRDARKKK